jgi:hypothetical protein
MVLVDFSHSNSALLSPPFCSAAADQAANADASAYWANRITSLCSKCAGSTLENQVEKDLPGGFRQRFRRLDGGSGLPIGFTARAAASFRGMGFSLSCPKSVPQLAALGPRPFQEALKILAGRAGKPLRVKVVVGVGLAL